MSPRLVLVAALVLGCGGERAPSADIARPPANAEAGMCAEHGVLESLCTKCHPALVAVFQQKGDWCPEHGFPESICPVCHPERGGRPAVDVAVDDAPRDGIAIVLARPEAAAVAGITTVAPVAAPRRTLALNGTLGYDATRSARVSARARGIVATIAVDVGAQVEAGALLATIDSPVVAELSARRDFARERAAALRKNLRRLVEAGDVVSERARSDAAVEAKMADGDVAIIDAQLARYEPVNAHAYGVIAPVSGTVVTRSVGVGESVDEQVLFELVDTTTLWATLEIPERDVAFVHVGDAVVVEGRSAPIRWLAPAIDARTRMVLARVALVNDGTLRANQIVTASMEVSAPSDAWLVPRAAVQRAKSTNLVFVKLTDDRYEGRRVEVGPSYPDAQVAVRGRLSQDDRVVVEGAFILKTETLRDSIGAGCCADDGAK